MVAVLIVSGCVGALDGDPFAEAGTAPTAAALAFTEPLQINRDAQEGFEPSIRIAPDDTIYVAAARGFVAGSDGSVASPVWCSNDNGLTWTKLASMLGLREKVKAVEGDLAVDARGTVYFVDTYAADNVVTVWGSDQTWMSTSPIQGTTGGDDRPWLAAHGDGVVYYVGNSLAAVPPPGAPSDGAARFWFYRSTDHAASWTLGTGFVGGDYCHVAASPSDDSTVAVVCSPGSFVLPAPTMVQGFTSRDRGNTWTVHELGTMIDSPDDNFPVVAFSPSGTAYAFWVSNDEPATLHLSSWTDGTWVPEDVPRADGPVANPALAAGPNGSVALGYYGRDGEDWYLNIWARNATGSPWMRWADPTPVAHLYPPEDFFQAAFDTSGHLHVAYQRNAPDELGTPKPSLQPILYIRQL
ncbi:MAG TPA: sialidase family protein [Candidatus Thermoplasmatota archaeon]